jgi:hypothetical protein
MCRRRSGFRPACPGVSVHAPGYSLIAAWRRSVDHLRPLAGFIGDAELGRCHNISSFEIRSWKFPFVQPPVNAPACCRQPDASPLVTRLRSVTSSCHQRQAIVRRMAVVHRSIKAIAGGNKIKTGCLVVIRSTTQQSSSRSRHDIDPRSAWRRLTGRRPEREG